MTISSNRPLLALAAMAAAIGLAGPAAAQPSSSDATVEAADVVTREVPVADLDLSRPADVRTLTRRIDRAAKSICEGYGVELREFYGCQRLVASSADAQVSALRRRAETLALAGRPARLAANLTLAAPASE